MTVRIVCDYCSGELQIPRESAAKKVRCPLCGRIFVSPMAVAVKEKAPPSASVNETLRDGPLVNTPTVAPATLPVDGAARAPAMGSDASTPWSPISEEDLDSSLPWYVLVGAMAPAGMLGFVAPEPAAFVVAAVLVAIALFVATRRNWTRISRITGVVSLALLGFGAAAAVNLYGDGSFANVAFRLPISGPDNRATIDLDDVAWAELLPPDTNASILFPGPVAKGMLGEPKNGIDIEVYQARFPKQAVIFTLHTFKLSLTPIAETTELLGLQKMDSIIPWVFYEGQPDQPKKAFYCDHPGLEYQFSVLLKKTRMVCRAYLVRDRAFLVSVSADNYEAIKPQAEKFLTSFRLTKQTEAMRSPLRIAEPDWKALGRPPIPKATPLASYRGHFFPPVIVLAFSADGKSLVSGSGGEHLLQWDLATGHGATIANARYFPFFGIQPSGKALVVPVRTIAGAVSEDIRFLTLDDPAPPLGAANTDFIAFPPDGKSVLVGLETQITAWDSADEKNLWHRSASESPLACLAMTRDGRLLATAGKVEGTIRLWDISKKGVDHASWRAHGASKWPAPIQQLAFAPDGKTLASAGIDTTVKIWNVSDADRPKLIANMMHEEPVSTVEYSNDGTLLATGDSIGVVRIWKMATGELLHEFRACEGSQSIHLMRFSPDDTKLAAAVEMGIGRAGVNLFEIKTLPPATAGPSVSFPQTDEPPLFKSK